jgi:hypothetical protein
MKTRAILPSLLLLLGAACPHAMADEALRDWTDYRGQTFRGKIVGFELDSFTVAREAGSIQVDGKSYNSLPAERRKLVDMVLDDEGFSDPSDALSKDGDKRREFSYVTVRFQTDAGRAVRLPLELLRGADDGTGDYRIAADKSMQWLQDREASRNRDSSDSAGGKDDSERLRRKAEEKLREDSLRRRWAKSRRHQHHRHHHHDYWVEKERLERQRRELARKQAELKDRERREKEEQAKKDKAKQDPPKKTKPRKDPPKEDPPKKAKPKKDPRKKDPPKKDPPKKDAPKKDKSTKNN